MVFEFVEDASYLRLQTLTLGVYLPKNWTKKAGMQRTSSFFYREQSFLVWLAILVSIRYNTTLMV